MTVNIKIALTLVACLLINFSNMGWVRSDELTISLSKVADRIESHQPLPGWNSLVYLFYKASVMNYCGLSSDESAQGFDFKSREIIDNFSIPKDKNRPYSVSAAQFEAWDLAHQEWSNRGLGGFRRWCKKEAARYQKELERIRLEFLSEE